MECGVVPRAEEGWMIPTIGAVTLPDVGVDMPGLVQAGLTALGAVVVVVVGGYFAFLAIRLAMKWARRIA